jgi:hypothetical protein
LFSGVDVYEAARRLCRAVGVHSGLSVGVEISAIPARLRHAVRRFPNVPALATGHPQRLESPLNAKYLRQSIY